MNKRGLVFLYTLMVGMCIIILGLAFATPIKQVVDDAMSRLTCSNPSSNFNQAACWYMDTTKVLVTGGIIFIGLAVIGARVIFS